LRDGKEKALTVINRSGLYSSQVQKGEPTQYARGLIEALTAPIRPSRMMVATFFVSLVFSAQALNQDKSNKISRKST
jgi:hypothetical protein